MIGKLTIIITVGCIAATVATAPSAAKQRQNDRPEVQVEVVNSSGFQWRDAGIGAAGGLGLALLVVGTLPAKRRRNQPSTRETS